MSEETDALRPVRAAKTSTEAHQRVTFELVDPEGAERGQDQASRGQDL
jgi:hypothetical protein